MPAAQNEYVEIASATIAHGIVYSIQSACNVIDTNM